jgi:hypothetical protein
MMWPVGLLRHVTKGTTRSLLHYEFACHEHIEKKSQSSNSREAAKPAFPRMIPEKTVKMSRQSKRQHQQSLTRC